GGVAGAVAPSGGDNCPAAAAATDRTNSNRLASRFIPASSKCDARSRIAGFREFNWRSETRRAVSFWGEGEQDVSWNGVERAVTSVDEDHAASHCRTVSINRSAVRPNLVDGVEVPEGVEIPD